MNPLQYKLSETDELKIRNQLERLFILQARPIKKEAMALFVHEIANTGYSLDDILTGINSLRNDPLPKGISFPLVMDAIRSESSKNNNTDFDYVVCDSCDNKGIIIMVDPDGRNYAYACKCSNGDIKASALKIPRWNGLQVQQGKNEMLTLRGGQND